MIIQVGYIQMDAVTNEKIPFTNPTKKYLLPCLKEYGNKFISKLNSVYKVAVGIGDIIVTKHSKDLYERHIFILLDSTIAPKFFINFLEWVKEEYYYENDYVYGDIQKSNYHMIVLKFPEKYYDSFATFQKGKYSEMFKNEEDFDFFKAYPDVKKVFIKDSNYRIEFTKKLNKWLNNDELSTTKGHKIKPHEWDGELDFPPNELTDTFNHHLKG